jgi:hypothetical protein
MATAKTPGMLRSPEKTTMWRWPETVLKSFLVAPYLTGSGAQVENLCRQNLM